jgi:alkylated DNA repair dioxygenase AlkB
VEEARTPELFEMFEPDRLDATTAVHLDLPDAVIDWYPRFFGAAEADRLYGEVMATTAWEQATVRMYGKQTPIPRLQAWYGDEGKTYAYSGIEMTPHPWTPVLHEIEVRLQEALDYPFNSVLANLYRDGSDRVAWHADDEPELGAEPVIASVSLGATRTFQLRHNADHDLRHSMELTHGSVLVMRGPTQHRWRHQLTKTARAVRPRINLTYRTIVE